MGNGGGQFRPRPTEGQMAETTKRTAFTKNGEQVYINEMYQVEGGWEGYTIGTNGYAVLVFIPEDFKTHGGIELEGNTRKAK